MGTQPNCASSNKSSSDANSITTDVDAETYYKWNFVVNVVEGVVYFFGLNIASFSTILPAYANKFTDSNFIISLIPTAMMLGFAIPQILSSGYTRNVTRKKRFVIIVGIPQRLSWFALAIATFFLAKGNPGLMLGLFFLCYITYTLSTGVIIPVWAEFTAAIIPQAKRGRFTGYRHFFSSGLGVLAAMLANYILKTFPYPQNFACCFFLTALFCTLAMPILGLSREVPYPKPKDTGSLRNYFKYLPHILFNNRNYSKYLITTILFSFQSMVNIFYTVYAIRILQVTDAQIAIFTGVLMGSQAASNIFWGYLADKKGHKIIIVIAMLSASIAPIVAITANSFFIYCGVFVFMGFSYSARMISTFNILFEFAPADEKATYISLTNTITAPFSGLAPILGGLLADLFGYKFIFTLSPGIGLVALFMLAFWVKEPRNINRRCESE